MNSQSISGIKSPSIQALYNSSLIGLFRRITVINCPAIMKIRNKEHTWSISLVLDKLCTSHIFQHEKEIHSPQFLHYNRWCTTKYCDARGFIKSLVLWVSAAIIISISYKYSIIENEEVAEICEENGRCGRHDSCIVETFFFRFCIIFNIVMFFMCWWWLYSLFSSFQFKVLFYIFIHTSQWNLNLKRTNSIQYFRFSHYH